MRTIMMAAALGAVALAGGAEAQQQPSPGALACGGKTVTIRYGKVKPGQLALFRKAVADHQAWYTAHGSKTSVKLVRVARGGAGGGAYDDTVAMTIVTYDSAPQPAHDAAYNAFVKEYRDSQTVSEEHRGCLG
jgi:hypothetical protein